MHILAPPSMSLRFVPVWRRNLLVWRKLAIPSILGNLADPLIYVLGLGYGLGSMLPEVGGVPYIAFLAAGMVCSSTMNSATFESMYSAFSRMHVQRTWDAIMNAPVDLDVFTDHFPPDVLACRACGISDRAMEHRRQRSNRHHARALGHFLELVDHFRQLAVLGDRVGILAVLGAEDHVSAGAERCDVLQPDGLAGHAQLVVRDPVTADVDAAQEGGESRHPRQSRRAEL